MRPEAGPAGAGNQSWSAHAQPEIGDDHAPKLRTQHRARPRPRLARRRGHQCPPGPSAGTHRAAGFADPNRRTDRRALFDRANATYALGEAVKLFVRTNEDAYVTALSIGPTGNVTQIFPNPFHPNNLVQAHHPIAIPGHGAHAVVTGALGAEVIKIIATEFTDSGHPRRPTRRDGSVPIGARRRRGCRSGSQDGRGATRTGHGGPRQDVSQRPAGARANLLQFCAAARADVLLSRACALLSLPPAPQEAEYGYSAPEFGYAAPEFGYASPEYDYPAPEYAYPQPAYGYPAPDGYPMAEYGYPAPAYGYFLPAVGP